MFSTRLSEFCTGAADSTRLTAFLSVCSDTGSILSPFLPPPFLYTLQITSPAAQGYLHNCPVKGLSSSTQLGSNTLSLIRINCSMRREYVTDLNCPVNFPVWLGLIVIRYYEMLETNFCCELCASLSSKPNVERCISTHPYFDSCAEIMETNNLRDTDFKCHSFGNNLWYESTTKKHKLFWGFQMHKKWNISISVIHGII